MKNTASDLIVRRVRVNRNRTSGEALGATGALIWDKENVVVTMPRGEGDEVEVVFFRLELEPGRSGDDLDKEFASRDLVTADPFAVMAINEVDPNFHADHSHSTFWRDANGDWCTLMFGSYLSEPYALIGGREFHASASRGRMGWGGNHWYAGQRKSGK